MAVPKVCCELVQLLLARSSRVGLVAVAACSWWYHRQCFPEVVQLLLVGCSEVELVGCTAVVVLQECLAVLAACGCTAEATGAFGIVAVLALACPLC